MDSQGKLVFAFDGDEIGKRHARAILSDDLDQVKEISAFITEGNNFIRDFVESHGGEWVSGGGDEGSFIAPPEFVENLEELRKDYQYIVEATLSIGYGETISQAGKALLAAKARGKDQIVKYDDSVEQEIDNLEEPDEEEKIKRVLSNNSEESNESSESEDGDEIEPSPPESHDNNLGYDSGYKDSDSDDRQDSYRANGEIPPIIRKPNLTDKPRVEEAVSGDMEEANRAMNMELPDPDDKPAEEGKPAPRAYHDRSPAAGRGEPAEGESHMQDKPSDLKYNNDESFQPQADIPIEDATSDVAEDYEKESMGEHCPGCRCEDHGDEAADEATGDLLDQHIENAKEMEDGLEDQSEAQSEEPSSETDALLDQHINNQADMEDATEDGVSRPNDFNEKANDMGLSEEDANDPNLDEVLRDGLDQHAQDIQKEKVLQLVGQALEDFKGQKQILDKAKEQAPELYSSCIAMLRAMIELCSLAGLDQSQPEQEVDEIEGQSESPEEQPAAEAPAEAEETPSEESYPTCGHKEAAPEEGAAPFPKK